MSALDALRTSLSGMNAQSTKLAGISNNIANSSTVGYKRVSTQFESLVIEGSSSGAYAMAGTAARNRVAIGQVGQVQRTGVDTDIAVNGAGFLVVNDQAGSNGKYLATRAGSFRTDQSGNLVNSAGYYLQGVKLGPDGKPVGSLGDNNVDSLTTVNIGSVGAAAAPTTEMKFWTNLPADQTSGTATLVPADTFQTTVDYYDTLGKAQALTYRFTPVNRPAVAMTPPSAQTNTWTLQVFDSAKGTGGATDPARQVAALGVEFSTASGTAGTIQAVRDAATLHGTPAGTQLTTGVPDAATNGNGAPGAGVGTYDPIKGTLEIVTGGGPTMTINMGAIGSPAGMTQLQGDFVTTRVEKDGSAFGLLQGVSVAEDGKVIASFSNGQSRPIYQLKLAMFANPDGLNPVEGDAYEMATSAGALRLLGPGTGAAGTTAGGALEASTVDIGTELTNLIETQRAYSSNATVIRTSDQMLEEAANLKR